MSLIGAGLRVRCAAGQGLIGGAGLGEGIFRVATEEGVQFAVHALNLVEAGLRWQMTPLTVLTAGVGAGFGRDSPDVRATIGFQHALTLFPLY